MRTRLGQIPFLSLSVLIAFVASLLVMLPSWNKYWAPYDEGNYLISGRMVMEGMVPYKDFFLIMYPPAYAYTLAGLFTVFGTTLLVSRIYNIILLSVICASVFYITRKFTGFKYSLMAFLMCLSTLAAWGEPPIARPIWPGAALSLVAVALIMDFIEKDKAVFFVLSSFFVGLATMFRHDIGFLTLVAVSAGLFAYSAYMPQDKKSVTSILKRAFRLLGMYSVLPLLFISVLAFYLYRVNALGEAKEAMFTWPATFHKWAAIPFPEFCFDFRMIFHRGCLFIRKNKFYIPMLMCLTSCVLFFMETRSNKIPSKRHICLIIILALGVLYLQQLVFRVDGNHLAVSFPPTAILFGLIFSYKHDKRQKAFVAIKALLMLFMMLLMLLLFCRNTEKYIKDIYVKPFVKKSIEPVSFARGRIYIPDDVRNAFVSLVKYVDEHTEKNEKIYVGHLKHKVPQMGWFDLIYFLTDRLPAVRYHVMILGFQSRDDIQEEMVRSLKRNNVRLILLRDFGETGLQGPLDRYIREEYKVVEIINSYHIYVKE